MNYPHQYDNMNTTEQPPFNSVSIPEYGGVYDSTSVVNRQVQKQKVHDMTDIPSIIDHFDLSYRLGKVVELILSSSSSLDHRGKIDLAIENLNKYRDSLR